MTFVFKHRDNCGCDGPTGPYCDDGIKPGFWQIDSDETIHLWAQVHSTKITLRRALWNEDETAYEPMMLQCRINDLRKQLAAFGHTRTPRWARLKKQTKDEQLIEMNEVFSAAIEAMRASGEIKEIVRIQGELR